MKVLGAHGIWTDGGKNIDRLLSWLASRYGYGIVDVNSVKRNPFDARYSADNDAQDLVDSSVDGDVVIAHSYGCLKTAKAMESRKFAKVFLFRPAMPMDYHFPDGDTEIHCIHSKGDLAILVGAALRFSHPFGDAGRVGFTSPRVINVKSTGGHNADFERLEHWGAYVHNAIRTLVNPIALSETRT